MRNPAETRRPRSPLHPRSAAAADSVDGRIKHALAADLDAAAARLDVLRSALCKPCRLTDVAERLTVAAKR